MARRKRSVWKGPYISNSLFNSVVESSKASRPSVVKTMSRNSVILPFFLGKQFLVYNGKSYITLRVNSDMIGHKLGEFVPTRLRQVYKKK